MVLAVAAAFAAAAGLGASPANAAVVPDPEGVYALQPGYSYKTIARSCVTPEQSTESGVTFPMPEDPDGKALFQAPGGDMWLLVHHELTQPRQGPGEFQGDAGKCHVDEQTPGDDDSDGWGSISRLTLAKDGTTLEKAEIIATGMHNLCASGITPWKTYITNEEFPFVNDTDHRSGWAWEVDPATGAQKRLDGMGRFSHEQAAYASNGAWYMTDDRGDQRYIYKFVPDNRRDLTTGQLYGLKFNRVTMTGVWIPLENTLDPDSEMQAKALDGPPGARLYAFTKAEGMVATGSSNTLGGNAVAFSESGAGSDPGRVWQLDELGNDGIVRGHVLVEGDWARLGRPDNLRYTDAGDLFIFEDHSGSDWRNNPSTGGVNQTWVLPRHEEGTSNLVLFAQTVDEATGPWFSFDNQLLYVSIQADPPRQSRVIAVRAPRNYNQPYDR